MNLTALKDIFSNHVESPVCRDNLLRAKWRQEGVWAIGTIKGLKYAVSRVSDNVVVVMLTSKEGAGCTFHIQH